MTMHSMLIEMASKWLQRQRCSVVITDMTHGGSETPDAIGWKGNFSILVECKASVGDFRADAQKPFRREPWNGMGYQRYFLAPSGVIPRGEIPRKWGLLELVDGKLFVRRKSDSFNEYNACQEVSILLSSIRRIGSNAPSGMAVRFYTIEGRNRASLGVEQEDLLTAALPPIPQRAPARTPPLPTGLGKAESPGE